jgi:hypothetical protein
MKKVAKLVSVTLTTRVIVDENATHEEIVIAASERLARKAQEELNENITTDDIIDDLECPFDEKFDTKEE